MRRDAVHVHPAVVAIISESLRAGLRFTDPHYPQPNIIFRNRTYVGDLS